MAKSVTITKHDNRTIQVKFSKDLPALAKLANGGAIPAEYLHAILNFHVANQGAKGDVSPKHADKMRPYW